MTPRAVRRAAAALFCVALFAGCTARHFALEAPPSPAPAGRTGTRLGLVVADAAPTANVGRVVPEGVVLAVARALHDTGRFAEVIYPYAEGLAPPADLVFAVEVRSRYDEHLVANLSRQMLVGASLLLLQPVLPTRRDLVVSLSARGLHAGAGDAVYAVQEVERLEYTWPTPSVAALDAWTTAAVRGAAVRLASALAADPDLPPGTSQAAEAVGSRR